MAEPLKNFFDVSVAESIADMIEPEYGGFDRDAFVRAATDDLESKELTERAAQMCDALAATLPSDRELALRIIERSVGPEAEASELQGMDGFRYQPMTMFCSTYGLDHFEAAMAAQYELTKRFTAEFSVRAFIEQYPTKTMALLRTWAEDSNVHVRRLVSEGTRPRLPWAKQLPAFIAEPSPAIELLELLKNDPEEYVRRSVANNLNDISKDHPGRVVAIANEWWNDDRDRQRMLRHALRTLIKQGDLGALDVLGYGPSSPARATRVVVDPRDPSIGDSVRIEVTIENPSDEPAGALLDFGIHFVKANGSTSRKVFKGGERQLDPRSSSTISKKVSLAQHSTRKHYPGEHLVDVQLNGAITDGGQFVLQA